MRTVVLLAMTLLPLLAGGLPAQAACEPDNQVEAYKPNYFLPWSYDSNVVPGEDRQVREAVFQLSIRKRVLPCVPFYMAYSQRSFWQVYDGENSRPFRESNYNPEFFFDWRGLAPATWNHGLQVGLEHESNGQDLPKSRSWNRLYGQLRWDALGQHWNLKTWVRLPEESEEKTVEPRADDNPDIQDYLGFFELRVVVPLSHVELAPGRELRVMLRKGRADESGTWQVDHIWPLPFLSGGLSLQTHYFYGYGESLIDYDRRVNRFALGVSVE